MASSNTSIEWTDKTWNPLRGCTRVSQGCTHCYAEKIAYRFSGPGQAFEGLAKKVGNEARWTGKIMLVEKELETPLKWKTPQRIFVNSVSDLFHEGVPFDYIERVFETMVHPDGVKHTYQILTKRPERALAFFHYFAKKLADFNDGEPDEDWLWRQPHIWIGTSVEDQKTAVERIPFLTQIPAAIRFLSCEPLLGPLDLEDLAWEVPGPEWSGNNKLVDWIIAGGESGPGSRPAHPDWFRSLRDQCQEASIQFFFKQWGNWLPCEKIPNSFKWKSQDGNREDFIGRDAEKEGWQFFNGVRIKNVGKKAAGRLLDGQTWDEFPLAEALQPIEVA